MGKRYEIGNDYFREEILAAMLFGFRNVKNPSTVTVHPELMVKKRENFKDKVISPKQFSDVEVFSFSVVSPGRCESADENRQRVENERVLHERHSQPS